MRNKGLILLALLCVLLVAAVVGGELWTRGKDRAEETQAGAQGLLDAVFDRIGATRWAELLQWYEMEEAGQLPDGQAGPDAPVWVARTGNSFHSIPVCGGMKSPAQMTLAEALAAGYRACMVCWEPADARQDGT